MESRVYRLLVAFCTFACVVLPLRAQSSDKEAAEKLLCGMESAMAALGCYEVQFDVIAEGYSVVGRYVVNGTDFYLAADDVELFVADGVKYEVNATKREIMVDGVESLGSDIVSNPTRGFTALLKDYVAESAEYEGRRAVRLIPRDGSGSSERILIVADVEGRMPALIRYISSEGAIDVRLKSVSKWSEPLPRFVREKYADYELVDFR